MTTKQIYITEVFGQFKIDPNGCSKFAEPKVSDENQLEKNEAGLKKFVINNTQMKGVEKLIVTDFDRPI